MNILTKLRFKLIEILAKDNPVILNVNFDISRNSEVMLKFGGCDRLVTLNSFERSPEERQLVILSKTTLSDYRIMKSSKARLLKREFA